MKIYSDWYSRHRFTFRFIFAISSLCPYQPTMKQHIKNHTKIHIKNLYLHSKTLYRLKMKFMSDVTFPSWLGKSVNTNFLQYQFDRNNKKFNCCLEIQSKMTARISICTLNSLKVSSNQIHIWCQFSIVARQICQPPLFPI